MSTWEDVVSGDTKAGHCSAASGRASPCHVPLTVSVPFVLAPWDGGLLEAVTQTGLGLG